MNNRQRKILSALFAKKVPKSIPFRDIESLLTALGCEVIEGQGSRVFFQLGEIGLDLHRPHPGKEALEYQVKSIRLFLLKSGIEP
jgi:hypothetical protein